MRAESLPSGPRKRPCILRERLNKLVREFWEGFRRTVQEQDGGEGGILT